MFEAEGTSVLIDAGIAPRTLEAKLATAGARLPDAIVITHAHQDHVGHALRLARRLKIPIHVSEATSRAVSLHGREEIRIFSAREPFAIGTLTIAPTPLPHDAAQVALVVEGGGRRAAIVTDLGEVPPGLSSHLARCDVVLIESNHDLEMLQSGPYPAFLKRRIASARGHLSNAQAHALLRTLPVATHTVVLMHLSTSNNHPEIALESAQDALGGRRVRLLAATQDASLVLDATPTERWPLLPASRGKPGQLSLFG